MATNIFAVNKTDDKNSERLDGERFVTKVVDVDFDAIDEEYDKYDKAVIEHEKKLEKDFKDKTRLPRWLNITFWVMTVAWIAAVVLYVSVERFGSLPESIPATEIAFVVSLVYIVLYAFRKSKQKKLIAKANEETQEESSPQHVSEIDYYEEARREMGVPENAQTVDIFTYVYKMSHGCEKRTNGKSYINLEMQVYAEDANLCIISANKKLTIPLSSVKGFNRIESKVTFMLWNKQQKYDDPEYAGYNIRRTGLFSLVMDDYYKLQIIDDGVEYEILIPGYDKDVFAAILGY